MFSPCLEFLGLGSSLVGTLLVMIACGLPTWKVSAFIDSNIVVAQTLWDGLWMSCVVQSTGQMQCKVHDSVLALPRDLQVARALTVTSAVTSVVALAVAVAGARYTNCVGDGPVKNRVRCAGGALYVLSGALVFVPLCWAAHVIVGDFYSAQVPPSKKREIGAAIYVGWASAALLVAGGALLCCSAGSLALGSAYPVKYAPAKTPSSDKDRRQYV